jgi:hypothetical protein
MHAIATYVCYVHYNLHITNMITLCASICCTLHIQSLGATFNHWNTKLTIWRQQHVHISRNRRTVEAVAVSLLMSIVCFTVPLLWGKCTQKPVDMENWTLQVHNISEFWCIFNQY